MSKVEFNYKGTITTLSCQENETMEEICKRYAFKSSININNIYFLYGGNKVNLQSSYNQIINRIDKERKMMSILVYEINNAGILEQKIIRSKLPICIKCKENARFELKDYKINLYGCKNNHIMNNIFIKEYEANQKIDLSKIECNKCKRKKYETYNNEMHVCLECNNLLCPLCKNNHNKEHSLINYDLRNYICNKHNNMYIAYCKTCNLNICIK